MTISRSPKPHYVITELQERFGLEKNFVLHCIRAHWILPAAPEAAELDEEDLARIRLIRDLKEGFGVNDESIPIILHLLDQFYKLRRLLQTRSSVPSDERVP